jgi:hypothetical protein
MDEPLIAEAFSPHVGRDFSIVGRPDRLTLVSIENGRPMPGAGRLPFILFFQSPRDRLLPEGSYEFEAEGGQRFAFHIMPIMTPPGDRQDYQVIFN